MTIYIHNGDQGYVIETHYITENFHTPMFGHSFSRISTSSSANTPLLSLFLCTALHITLKWLRPEGMAMLALIHVYMWFAKKHKNGMLSVWCIFIDTLYLSISIFRIIFVFIWPFSLMDRSPHKPFIVHS